jgi:hypothetical protein
VSGRRDEFVAPGFDFAQAATGGRCAGRLGASAQAGRPRLPARDGLTHPPLALLGRDPSAVAALPLLVSEAGTERIAAALSACGRALPFVSVTVGFGALVAAGSPSGRDPRTENLALSKRQGAGTVRARGAPVCSCLPRTGQRSRKPGTEDWLPKGGRELSPERNLPDRPKEGKSRKSVQVADETPAGAGNSFAFPASGASNRPGRRTTVRRHPGRRRRAGSRRWDSGRAHLIPSGAPLALYRRDLGWPESSTVLPIGSRSARVGCQTRRAPREICDLQAGR